GGGNGQHPGLRPVAHVPEKAMGPAEHRLDPLAGKGTRLTSGQSSDHPLALQHPVPPARNDAGQEEARGVRAAVEHRHQFRHASETGGLERAPHAPYPHTSRQAARPPSMPAVLETMVTSRSRSRATFLLFPPPM